MSENTVRPEHEAHIRSIARSCRGPMTAEMKRVLPASVSFCRAGPGGSPADFNDVLVSNPFDGQEREHKCGCGVVVTYRSPRFEDA